MSTKKLYAEKITRDEINEAVKQYLSQGGKIKRIEVQQKAAGSLLSDSFEFQDSLTTDDLIYLDLGFTNTSV